MPSKTRIIEFEALGTHWWITFFGETELGLQDDILQIVDKFEMDYSRFKDTSYVSILNKKKKIKNAGDELLDLLKISLDFYNKTNGIFNISVGSQLEKLGYGTNTGSLSQLSNSLNEDILIKQSTIELHNNISIDLGGIGKGYLIDKLANYLTAKTKDDFIINGGGDLYVKSKKHIKIELEHPTNPDESIGYLRLKNQALAVSSPVKRQWINTSTNSKQHHIIDPKTGQSRSRFLCSFVVANNAITADVMGTVLLLANKLQRRKYQREFECEYLLVNNDLTSIISNNFEADLY